MTKASNSKTGIILCGGKSNRMGKNKALLSFGKDTIIELVAKTLSTICDQVIISTNSNELYFLPYTKVADKLVDIGPIAGFHSSLLETKTEHNFIVSCDTPFISSALLLHLFNHSKNYDVVLPVFENHLQPMTGYFNKNIIKIIENQIEAGNIKPINIFENAKMNALKIDSALNFYHKYLFFNINSPEEYEQAKLIHKSIF
ncbi:MAG: molybdenum cofactor guanylyltransferase [Bacteroidales bacterium]|nr:molybdenum cofactor guanylyltransferase [Bacteroidales bacterium]